MHVLFVHQNYPAQFGHIADVMVNQYQHRCTFVSQLPSANINGVERIQYRTQGGAREATHYCSRTFENFTWHSFAVYSALKNRPEIRPDLIVGHSGFGSTVFLADRFDCPIINYCEYFYRAHDSDMDFRSEYEAREMDVLRARLRNAGLLVDLQTCTAAYSPTQWQRSLFPVEYQYKMRNIFDGIDTTFWSPRRVDRSNVLSIGNAKIPPNCRVVTYVSRGFESMRGFDIFMKAAKKISETRDDVRFVCVGTDRVCYGGDLTRIEEASYKDHVLAQDHYDPDRFLFTGRLPTEELAGLLSISDLHIYLTVPFVLSWSLMNALSCGCTVLASDTAPVQEMITDGVNGLLVDFFDVDAIADRALDVLQDSDRFRELGMTARQRIVEQYGLDVVLPQTLQFYEDVRNGSFPSSRPAG